MAERAQLHLNANSHQANENSRRRPEILCGVAQADRIYCRTLFPEYPTILPQSTFQSIARHTSEGKRKLRGEYMLWTIFVILLVLWLLGVVSSYTLGGFIHILLVLALIALVFQLISGRRPVV